MSISINSEVSVAPALCTYFRTLEEEPMQLSVSGLLTLAQNHPSDKKILSQVLETMYWLATNKKNEASSVKAMSSFLAQVVGSHPVDTHLGCLCSLVYQSLSKGDVLVSKNIDQYLREGVSKSTRVLYLPSKQTLASNFQDISAIVQSAHGPHVNRDFQLLLNHFAHVPMPWKQELLAWTTKKQVQKQLLLRIITPFDKSQNKKILISQKDEISWALWLPVPCLRTVQGLIAKLQISGPFEALQTIMVLPKINKSHPRYQELLIMLVEKHVEYPGFRSLEQIQRTVVGDVEPNTVISKLKEKASVHNRDSNRQSKKFFVMVPLLLNKTQTQLEVSEEIGAIFGHETFSIKSKFYVAEFLVRKMVQSPLKKFATFLARQLQSGDVLECLKTIHMYLKKLENLNKATMDWVASHFSDISQRLLQILFSQLMGAAASEAAQILFQLEKFSTYGRNWLSVYRWVILALERPVSDELTLDYLQLLEMLLEKVSQGCLPANVVEKFQRTLAGNWHRYTHEHYFAIVRIVEHINRSSMPQFKKRPLPNLSDLFNAQKQFKGKGGSDPIDQYLHSFSWNLVFQHVESQLAVRTVLKLFDYLGRNVEQIPEKKLTMMLQIILFVYEDDQALVESDVDDFVLKIVSTISSQESKSTWKSWKFALQYIAKVPHSINLLKLPLSDVLTRGFYQKQWLQSTTDILEMVVDSKPKSIVNFKLQPILKSILTKLITLESKPTDEYLDFLDVVFSAQSDYQNFLTQNMKLLQRILIAERQLIGYRNQLVKYLVGLFLDYDQNLHIDTVKFLFFKYASDAEIIDILLDYTEQKGWQTEAFDQQLMMSLVLTHTQQTELQAKIQNMFNTCAPPSDAEKQFMRCLGEGNYDKCEKLLEEIVNPFGLEVSLPEVRGLLEWKDAPTSAKKLLRFLYDHPTANQKFHACQAFYTNKQFHPMLAETLSTIKSDPSFTKFTSTPTQAFCTTKKHPLTKIIFQTLSSIITNKVSVSRFKIYLMDIFKNNEDAVVTIVDLIAVIFGNLKAVDESSNANINLYYKFLWEIVGEWELKDKNKVNRYNLKQLLYIFPYTLGWLGSDNLHFSGLLLHYSSLLQEFRVIKGQIGSQRYVQRVRQNILDYTKEDSSQKIIENYMYLHIDLQNQNELTGVNQLKFLETMLNKVNTYIDSKLSNSSNKLQPLIVLGYITTVLHSVSAGCQVDPPSREMVAVIDQHLDEYGLQEESKKVIKSAIEWILSKYKNQKEQPVKKEVRPVLTPSANQPIQQPYMQEPASPTRSPKRQHFASQAVLSQYSSMRRPEPEQQQEKDESDLKKQAEQSYIRYKQTQERVTIIQTEKQTNTTLIILEENTILEQPAISPLNLNIVEEPINKDIDLQNVSQSQRAKNLQQAKKIEGGEFSIQSLKDHCKFIASLADLPTLSPNQFAQLIISLDSITQTVLSHAFYVKKVADNETAFKLTRIWKNLNANKQQSQGKAVAIRTLKLWVAMADKKQKKMQLFAQDDSIQFLKVIIKKALNKQPSEEEILLVTQLLYACRSNTDIYFKSGLFSMILELINRNLSADLVVDYLIRIDLSATLINEIYQRGLFNKLVEVVSQPPKDAKDRALLNLWIRLAGKVCISKPIQERFRSKQLHIKVWQLMKNQTDLAQKLNLCYFYAYLCVKNEVICQWLMQTKVIQQLLLSLKTVSTNQQLYILFYHFCFNNDISRDYSFRLKYHLHLLERLTSQSSEEQHLSKFFYKSLGQMMSSQIHTKVFFKQEAVKKLIDSFDSRAQPAIYECLLDFISVLDTQQSFDQLRKQRFWDSIKLFEYKVSNEATYSYLLQIFLVMIKKGRTKQFNQPDVRTKVCLKAEYSINMEGKELALRFIIALSIKNKQNYLTERAVKLLASIMGLKVSHSQLYLASEMLKIQGQTGKQQFLAFYGSHNIDSLIAESLPTLSVQSLPLALHILQILCVNPGISKTLCAKMMPYPQQIIQIISQSQICKCTLKLLHEFSAEKSNRDKLVDGKVSQLLQNNVLLNVIKNQSLEKQYAEIVSNLVSNTVLEQNQISQIGKAAQKVGIKVPKGMVQEGSPKQKEDKVSKLQKAEKSFINGHKVKMYKTDGSVSQLLIFISSDLLELNCAQKLNEAVKQKWRLPLNEIQKIIIYSSQESPEFQNSVFEKNSGFFSKAPNFDCCLTLLGKNIDFHPCFSSKQERQQWLVNLQILKENAVTMLSKLK